MTIEPKDYRTLRYFLFFFDLETESHTSLVETLVDLRPTNRESSLVEILPNSLTLGLLVLPIEGVVSDYRPVVGSTNRELRTC